MTDSLSLVDLLGPAARLALAYAPARTRPLTLGLLALDQRLGDTIRSVREPVLAQIRLAWWREQLETPGGAADRGEPLLAALAPWGEQRAALARLTDGWEEMIGEAPLDPAALAACAAARAAPWAVLAQLLGHDPHEALRAGQGWALADLAPRLSHPDERAAVLDLAAAHDWRRPRLPRDLRPLLVLHGLARRSRGQEPLLDGGGSMVAALRLGLLGR